MAAVATMGAVMGLAWVAAPDDGKGPLPAVAGPPRWFKGNLHTHSLWSDGDDFPEMIADWYRRQGYQFLALSEHNVLAEGQKWVAATDKSGTRAEAVKRYQRRFGKDWVELRKGKAGDEVRLKPLSELRSLLEEPGRFLLIPAEEVTGSHGKLPVHMNALNLRDVLKPIKADSVAEMIRVNLRAGAEQGKKAERPLLTFLNHPNYGWGVNAEDLKQVDELSFFEVYNGHPGVRNAGDKEHPSTEAVWDEVLTHRLSRKGGRPLYGLATDDAHNYHKMAVGQSNPGRGWVMAQAPYLTCEAILAALEAGRFYVSTGVTLDSVEQRGGRLALKIRPTPGVTYRTEFIAAKKGGPASVVHSSDSLEPSYRLTGEELYVRARVISSRKHPNPSAKGENEMAWTQPVIPSPAP
jgi:hypothetical protein